MYINIYAHRYTYIHAARRPRTCVLASPGPCEKNVGSSYIYMFALETTRPFLLDV